MNVMIGIGRHKSSHMASPTAVAIDGDEDQLLSVRVTGTRRQLDESIEWAEPFDKLTRP